MNNLEIARVAAAEMTVERFLADHVAQNHPVIVTGALATWNGAAWTPPALEQRFGDRLVQVYNNYFDLQTLMPLKRYLSEHFGQPDGRIAKDPPYVRWYSKLRDVEFCWADNTLAQLQDEWVLPLFLPDTDYLLPYTPAGGTSSPVTDHFPARGLFISPRGARTGLHVDPWASCAVLCQLFGTKRWYFYSPEQAPYLRNDLGTVDVTRPDMSKFPAFSRARLTGTCTLGPGEVIYVPHGWFHQVESDSDSVSLTWNFVHRTTVASFVEWLNNGTLSEFDESVLRFFYGLPLGGKVARKALARIHGENQSR